MRLLGIAFTACRPERWQGADPLAWTAGEGKAEGAVASEERQQQFASTLWSHAELLLCKFPLSEATRQALMDVMLGTVNYKEVRGGGRRIRTK